MVGKKTLKDYELNSMYDYFEMCLNSLINGQYSQARKQALKLSKYQRSQFIDYLPEITSNNNGEIKHFTDLFIIN